MAVVPCLHLIVDGSHMSANRLTMLVASAVNGGVEAVHLRDRSLPASNLLDVVERLRQTIGRRAKVIVNDRVDVAMLAGADGVHLPERGLSPDAARRLLGPSKTIGVSIHSVGAAIRAQELGADYLFAGHIFETESKPGEPGRGLEFFREVVCSVDIPVIGIGGIDARNAGQVLDTGAHGVAVISAILDSEHPDEVSREIRDAFSNVRIERP